MILIVNVCKEPLHYFEFVKPIEDIAKKNKAEFVTKHYNEISDVKKFDKVIICGTSLKDKEYLKNIEKFEWIKNFKNPILGICAGMQIIGKVFGGKLFEDLKIGSSYVNFKKEFLSIFGKREIYELHKFNIDIPNFEKFAGGKAVKFKNIYCTIFHPEVRNKEIIEYFITKIKKD